MPEQIATADDTEAIAREVLEPGERLLWSGRPIGDKRARQRLWAGAAFFAAWPVYRMIRTGLDPRVVLILGIAAVVLTLLAAGPYLQTRQVYALTDRRILIIYRLFRRTEAHSLRRMTPGNVEAEWLDATRGRVWFKDFAQRCSGRSAEPCVPEFFAIPNPDGVAALIRRASDAARQSIHMGWDTERDRPDSERRSIDAD